MNIYQKDQHCLENYELQCVKCGYSLTDEHNQPIDIKEIVDWLIENCPQEA